VAFPATALSFNIILIIVKNFLMERRQRLVSREINSKYVDYLHIARNVKRFFPLTWADLKPGHIIRIKNGQEFPADCLILDT